MQFEYFRQNRANISSQVIPSSFTRYVLYGHDKADKQELESR